MQHISTTPFGRRPVTAGLLAARALAEGEGPCPGDADKWQILRDLGHARRALGVSDRDLAVLAALVSFHPEAGIAGDGPAIVFPSNAALAARAHGMAESTLRRHLAALVAAGLILRHDSPNGKRYAVRGESGAPLRAFGFDLRPLAVRAPAIAAAAREAREAAEHLRRLRETVVLRLRDAEKLVAYAAEALPGCWDALADAAALAKRALRRKLDALALEALDAECAALLAQVNTRIAENERAEAPSETEEMSGNDADSGRHIQDSTRLLPESEPCCEQPRAEAVSPSPEPQLPLHLVLRACPDLLDYAPYGIRHWYELVSTAAFVRPMLGISPDAWDEAQRAMSPPVAAIALACILQRAEQIARPGGYLRALARKAEAGSFSPGPMVMALLRAENTAPV